jgi:hypothetical protein
MLLAVEKADPENKGPYPAQADNKPSKIMAWLKRMVIHDPVALDRALVRFLLINMVLFLGVLLYINRGRTYRMKLPVTALFTKYFRKPKETDDQD